MSAIKLAALAVVLITLSTVSAHGMVSGVVAGGVYHPGYTINYAYSSSHPPMAAWSAPGDKDTGFINPGNYTNPDIICHKGATPGSLYATVAAGSTVELQWSDWPESHHGPVIDYLANCNGECTSVDKTKLQFTKIDGEGLLDYTSMPGNWASDKLKAANNSWTVTIPESVAPGNYVLRHEIIALHSAQNPDGAQNYPQCVNLKVTGYGTDKLTSGTLGTQLYTPKDAGIFVNIYSKLTYTVPGPKLYSGASSGTPTSDGSPSVTSSPSPETSSTDSYGTNSNPSSTATTTTTTTTTPPPYPTNSNTTSPILFPGGKKAAVKKPHTSMSQTPTSTPPSASTTETTASSPSTTLKVAEAKKAPSSPSTPSIEPNARIETPSAPQKQSKAFTGMTTQELLEWLDLIVTELRSRLGSKSRRHARDFLGLM
ncbi:MAG: hypothetical protein L6R40_004228 [Gallowayella cf. fulva]|nr:MAG: hypothetical protein L6R40_004228 [Xanthomendoza cf. fulva]